jgi:hypothetical protein
VNGDPVDDGVTEFNFGTGFRFERATFLGFFRAIGAPVVVLNGCTRFRIGVEVAVGVRLELGLGAGVL